MRLIFFETRPDIDYMACTRLQYFRDARISSNEPLTFLGEDSRWLTSYRRVKFRAGKRERRRSIMYKNSVKANRRSSFFVEYPSWFLDFLARLAIQVSPDALLERKVSGFLAVKESLGKWYTS